MTAPIADAAPTTPTLGTLWPRVADYARRLLAICDLTPDAYVASVEALDLAGVVDAAHGNADAIAMIRAHEWPALNRRAQNLANYTGADVSAAFAAHPIEHPEKIAVVNHLRATTHFRWTPARWKRDREEHEAYLDNAVREWEAKSAEVAAEREAEERGRTETTRLLDAAVARYEAMDGAVRADADAPAVQWATALAMRARLRELAALGVTVAEHADLADAPPITPDTPEV